MESTTDFTVDATSVSPTGEGKVKAFVTSPAGTRMEALVNNNNDGTYKCMYTPVEQGKYFKERTTFPTYFEESWAINCDHFDHVVIKTREKRVSLFAV